MINAAKIYPFPPPQSSLQAVFILEINHSMNLAKLDLSVPYSSIDTWARIPVELHNSLHIGDEVLIAGDNDLFILNILTKSPQSEKTPLKVYSKDQELLFEYNPQTNKSSVFINKGDLEFITQDGDIILNSSKELKLIGNKIDITSSSTIDIGSNTIIGQQPAIKIGPQNLELTSPKLDLKSQQASVAIEEMHYTGRNCSATIQALHLIGKKLNIAMKTISQKTDDLFQKINGLSQLQAGRKHTVIKESYHLRSKRIILKSDKDCKIKGEKIHLG